jgi:hypothetical protein
MKQYKYFFIGFYLLAVLGSVQGYKKQYGMEVLSPIGIFDNFVFSLLPAAIFTAIVMLIHKLYLRLFRKSE